MRGGRGEPCNNAAQVLVRACRIAFPFAADNENKQADSFKQNTPLHLPKQHTCLCSVA